MANYSYSYRKTKKALKELGLWDRFKFNFKEYPMESDHPKTLKELDERVSDIITAYPKELREMKYKFWFILIGFDWGCDTYLCWSEIQEKLVGFKFNEHFFLDLKLNKN